MFGWIWNWIRNSILFQFIMYFDSFLLLMKGTGLYTYLNWAWLNWCISHLPKVLIISFVALLMLFYGGMFRAIIRMIFKVR